MAKTKLARHNKLRNYGLALSSFIIAFILGTTLIAPVFDRRFDVLNIYSHNKESQSVGEDTLKPYIYWTAPVNSFGASSFKDVNWSYFKQLFNQHTSWVLEYKRYSSSSWTNGNQYLTIEKTWNESGFWKFNLILDVPVNVYSARFTFGCDLSVLDYVEKVGTEVYINYTVPGTNEVYNCMFNWSDIASIPNLVVTKGKTDNMFWFRFSKNNIPSGHYEFDPTFGQTISSSNVVLRDSGSNSMKGLYSSPVSSGTANNITIYTGTMSNSNTLQCALYVYTDYSTNYMGNLIATTDTQAIASTDDNKYFTLSFPEPQPSLIASTNYYIVCCFTTDSGSPSTDYFKGRTDCTTGIYKSFAAGVTWSSPMTSESANTYTPYIYCSYTAAAGTSWHVISNTINGTIFNSSSYHQINLWNGSIFNTSVFEAITDWNGTVYNTSTVAWNLIADWNGSIYNETNWIQVSLFNGTIYNESSWYQLALWNGTLFNTSQWNLIDEYNGTIYNATVEAWQLVQEFNGTIFNQSLWNQINLWNGSIFNASSYSQIALWNGSLFNTSSWHQINLWNGSIYNISIGWIQIQEWNGSLYTTPSFNTINDWNGSIYNQSSWQDQEWNGSIYNASSYYQINNWNGSLYNQSTWHQISLWNGSLYNISIGFVLIQNWNGTIWNQSLWHDIDWNGSIFNTSSYSQVALWNGTVYNQSGYHLISEYNGTIHNVSIGFIPINDWNGSIYNQSTWNLIQNWNGSICNQTTSNLIQEWNGSIYNASHSYEINTWNGSIYNTSSFNTISDWNGTIFNSSLFNLVNQWNGSIYNQSSYNQVEQWNGTIYNISIGFVLVQNWNGSIYNQSSWSQVSLWNGTVFNTSAFKIVNTWNGTIYNQSQAHTINLWNGTIFNISGMIQIQDWNGTIFNASTFNQILLWNGSIFNTTFYVQINLWNGSIYNTTGAMLITEWNGSIYNGTGLGAIITISNPHPSNNSNHIKINVTLSITINHLNGNQMNITWYWGNSSANATHYLGSTLNVANGTYSMAIAPANQTYTDYWWNVNVTSGSDYITAIYKFTTGIKGVAITVSGQDRFIMGLVIGSMIFLIIGFVLFRRRRRKI